MTDLTSPRLNASRFATLRLLDRPTVVAFALLIFAVLVRARDYGNPVAHVDEQYYLLVGDRLLHGARLYIDLWDRKPPGLFLLFAGFRLLPGDGFLAYQLVATLCAAATGWLIWLAARRMTLAPPAGLAAGAAYILWLPLLSGGSGQSPVFYNLAMTAAAVLTLELPRLAERRAVGAIGTSGVAACLLAGIAIQIKYTPLVEGAFFGLAHLWYLWRARASVLSLGFAALLWMVLGLLPTALIVLQYWMKGPAAFDAFWFANFTSITLRRGYPMAKIVGRLAGIGGQLLPLIACAVIAWRKGPQSPAMTLTRIWLIFALVAFAMIGAFFDHYALPLVAPLSLAAVPAFAMGRKAIVPVSLIGTGLFIFHAATNDPSEGDGIRRMARMMAAVDGAECPYVFAGDSSLYHLSGGCVPTAYAFPSSLAYEAERGAIGVDETAEVARILARRPPAIVTLDDPFSPWNVATQRLMIQALARDYRPVMAVPREGRHEVLYVRRDRLVPPLK
ncbi:hypothetical protein NZL82_02585 [Sphingomonas sanguinis]|uniref:ArnT family glycosyltransferase n=1 Tax=Sphingomonas sp. LC-1 TaxID=3110957 RepID=UPI0021BA3BDB|nr:hypothetical protein [Sphingomonas sp. LC-1]MCT8000760.1 hypothetical protein [Sphingomonas sp. LC-1]